MKSKPVGLKQVTIEDAFWAPRIRKAREATIPYQWAALNDRVPGATRSGAARNFRIAAGKAKGRFYGCVFQDSDLGKWLEAAAYSLGTHPDKRLQKTVDGMIDLIAGAQDKDGYLDTAFTLKDRNKRWTNLRDWHELYVMGHLMEAAVAYYQATGKRKFMDVMARAADHIATVLGRGKGKKRGYPGHEEIELALVKLYRATGRKKYLDLARYFIDERGRRPFYFAVEAETRGDGPQGRWAADGQYNQSHLPVRRQSDAVGHAVRAMYLYCGMADVAAETGDKQLVAACKRLWQSVVERKMYVTGGVGSSASAGEAFTLDYELPNETAYTETCAAVGLVFWAQRMLSLDVDGRYADVMERALYNGVISGISLDGKRFFYSNPLAACPGSGIDGNRATRRFPWVGCACCPPNLLRLLTSLGSYVYSQRRGEVFVHLYIGGTAELKLGGQTVTLEQKTRYPWDQKVRIRVVPQKPAPFTLSVRVPGWCRGAKLRVNGKAVAVAAVTTKGYARIRRPWRKGDRLELTLPMPPERVYAHPKVRASAGRAALRRGPVVYCLEEADNGPDLNSIVLPASSALRVRSDRKLLGGVPVISAAGRRADCTGWKSAPYRTVAPGLRPAAVTAIPYFLWANRNEGEMLVWLRRC